MTVYTPTSIINQSHVIVMFASGAGVEVVENNRHMTARVYLPLSFMVYSNINYLIVHIIELFYIKNQTRGLFGNWSTDLSDDFVLPDGSKALTADINNLENLHKEFGMKCEQTTCI